MSKDYSPIPYDPSVTYDADWLNNQCSGSVLPDKLITVGKVYNVRIHSEINVRFTSRLMECTYHNEGEPLPLTSFYEGDQWSVSLVFENGVVFEECGMCHFDEV